MTILNEDNSLAYMMAGRKRDPFASRRAFAQKLAEQGSDTSPIQSPWQGVGRLAQALAGAFGNYTADAAEKEAGTALATKIADAGKLTDPAAKLAAYAAIDPSIGLRYSAQSAAEEIKKKTQRDDDLQTANFMIGGPPGTQQAGGPPGAQPAGGGVNPNNIGNVRPNGQSTGFQQPATLEDGIRLTVNNARAYPAAYNGGQPMTLTQIGQRWAPRGDGANDPDQWARNVASIGGLDPNQPIDLNNPQIAAQFARGVHGAEKGANVALPVQAYHSVLTGQGGPQQAVLRGPPGVPTPIGTYTPGTSQVQLAQGSADGSGTPLPPQNLGGDPGAQYFAAAQRAQAAGRGDIAIKFMQQATAAREAAATRDANRTLIPREQGPDLVWFDSRTGQPVSVVPGGAKKAPGEAGAIPGQGIENQARNALVRASNDPAYRASADYAALYGNLSRPRIDPATGYQIPPEDLSAFPPPTFRFQGQPQPQGAPQQPPQAAPPQAAATPPGTPPAPVPPPGSGPAIVAQPPQGAPPQAPPSGIVATPIPGMPAKPMTNEQALAAGFTDRMANSNSLLGRLDGEGLSAWGALNEKIPMVGNYRQTPEYRQYKQARDDFINAQLRRESGAAISDPEYDRANKQYFPQPGDDPGTLTQKAKNRMLVVEAMRRNAGPSYTQNPASGSAPPPAPPAPPPPPGFRPL